MNHSNNNLSGLDISSKPEIFIFARDTQTISAVRINGTEARGATASK